MTALDRITAAINDDSPISAEAQAELVTEILNRRAIDSLCRSCAITFIDRYCSCCGAMQPRVKKGGTNV